VKEGWKLLPVGFAIGKAVFVDDDDDAERPPTMGVVEFAEAVEAVEAVEAEKANEPGGDSVCDFLTEEAKVGDVGTEGAGSLRTEEGGERIKKLAMTARKKQISPRVRIVHGQLTSWKRLRVA
jgi:hypothetical protein